MIPFLYKTLVELVHHIFIILNDNFGNDLLTITFLYWCEISCHKYNFKEMQVYCSLPVPGRFWRNLLPIFHLLSRTKFVSQANSIYWLKSFINLDHFTKRFLFLRNMSNIILPLANCYFLITYITIKFTTLDDWLL